MTSRRHAIADELRRAVAALDAAEGRVTVKPLVWYPADNDAGKQGLWFCSKSGDVIKSYHGQKGAGWTSRDEWYTTIELAQAAAQANYDARIMSAITITAPSDKIAEAAIAAAMWREEAVDAGTPDSVAEGRTYEAFGDQSPELQARWLKFSRAALRAPAGKGE
ncbi:hypothetical protein [Cypionkella sp. TWP1-2-1b2]|uniref:hypothetical protein n=1 Tax=Cypionkella sp. TWP1-2-1b2 TaxID=2804675 RepID=UPI003CE81997